MKTVVSGVLLLDKPKGISSHSALAKVKFLFKSDLFDSKKAGHTGTLDPMATGLLPLCFGEATKFAQYGLDAVKGYTAIIKLGSQTDTGDAEGAVIATQAVPDITDNDLQAVAHSLLGEQSQIPPMYSALKKDGKKLYEYARAGITIERTARPITINKLTLERLSVDELLLSVVCSKGTYVRVLGESIAEQLGTLGHLSSLRRTKTGDFELQDAVSLDELLVMTHDERLARLLPTDFMIRHLAKIELNPAQRERVFLGQRLNIKDLLPQGMTSDEMVRLYCEGVFIGLGLAEVLGRLQPKKMIGR